MKTLLGLLIYSAASVYGLSAVAKPVRRIAIIGSGISGLSVAHSLMNNSKRRNDENHHHGFDVIDIFDARSSLDTSAGAGIQLNGGLSVLGKINPQLQEAVYAAGLPQVRVQSRSQPWWDTGKVYDTLLELDLKQTVKSAGGDIASSLLSASDVTKSPPPQQQRLWWISIMRGALQRVLLDTLPSNSVWKLQFQKKLAKLEPRDQTDGGVFCHFTDGTESGPYDLVIGCEGINSVTKKYVESNGRINEMIETDRTSDSLVRSAIYSGLRIRYAVADGDPSQQNESTATLTQFFGSGAYALHGVYGAGGGQPNAQCAFIVYLDENYIGPFKIKDDASKSSDSADTVRIGENADWTQDQRRTVDIARERMLEQLRTSQIPSHANDDNLGQTIARADRFFELGSYYHNPFGPWSCTVPGMSHQQAHVVLCGDAAHALPPFLGQGSNQAIQDAYCLVEKIVEYNARIRKGDANVNLQTLLNEYQTVRWPACFNIFWKAAFLGYLETGGIDGFYGKFRDIFFKSMGAIGVASKVLLAAASPKI
jgi:salicylate hydroxylase